MTKSFYKLIQGDEATMMDCILLFLIGFIMGVTFTLWLVQKLDIRIKKRMD